MYTATRSGSVMPASLRAACAMAMRARRSSGSRNAAKMPSPRAPATCSRRFLCAAMRMGGRGEEMTGGLHGASCSAPSSVAPSGDAHMASITSSARSSPAVRSRGSGNGYP